MFSFPPLTPLVKKLIITLLSAFVLELLLQNFASIDVIGLLALDPSHLGPQTAWQLFTYALIEDPRAVMSMLIGLVFMWLILAPFESSFGTRRTLELSVAGVLGAAVAAIIAGVILPSGFILIGSHSIAYAGMAAMTQVMQRGRMLFFGVVPMTSQQLLIVLVGLCLLEFLASKDHVMLAGSLGAMAAGIGYVRYLSRPTPPKTKKRTGAPRFRVVRGGNDDSDRPKWLN